MRWRPLVWRNGRCSRARLGFRPPLRHVGYAAKNEAGNTVSESGSIVAETAARIFADLADPQEVNSARDAVWQGRLWQALTDAGLTLAWVPEQNGGAGAELADGFAILGVAGRYAAAVPLAETLLAPITSRRAAFRRRGRGTCRRLCDPWRRGPLCGRGAARRNAARRLVIVARRLECTGRRDGGCAGAAAGSDHRECGWH